MTCTKKATFKPNHYYHCGNLDKFGFEAILLCTKRVNHRDGDSHVRFTITDLEIRDFNPAASEFMFRFAKRNQWLMFYDEEYEAIDNYYFPAVCAEDETTKPTLALYRV